ncbi:hypothetical protein PORY_001408 [Pneumocystis oryctolagi]|uniref:Uncharacterized protein n=1 Tax=Pneumocystis oryctolagi TaxID=42067 RepID=A0ACB7CE43_9ASCO|nr:hypothetical protein PORY_001408 [Pneumocystis oryctolagi]
MQYFQGDIAAKQDISIYLIMRISPHILFWKTYARPFARVFLTASVTYFGLHFLWWHLYTEEKRTQKKEHLSQLENVLYETISKSRSKS